MNILTGLQWRDLAERHCTRAGEELADIAERRSRGTKHPIDDFLFTYYSLRPSQLRAWNPGIGTAIADAHDFPRSRFHRVVDGLLSLDARAFAEQRSVIIGAAHDLLEAAHTSVPRFGCFGMHEWAMVHGQEQKDTRHPYLPLRFPPPEIMRIVEEVGCRCSHFDAFRFFTTSAIPLNVVQPTRQRQAALDQAGCLHVNMDLYKWAGKLAPAVSAELLLDTFVLAREIRVVDMAASAYDLSAWSLAPIRVETPEGRAEYVALQRDFAERARPLRERLLAVTRALAAASTTQ